MLTLTEQLLATLKSITEGMHYSSEDFRPIQPIVWKVAERGVFSFASLLQYDGCLNLIKLDDFIQEYYLAEEYFEQCWQKIIRSREQYFEKYRQTRKENLSSWSIEQIKGIEELKKNRQDSQLLMQEMKNKSEALIQLIQSRLSNLQIYELKNYKNESLIIITGQTKSNNWVGFSPISHPCEVINFGGELLRRSTNSLEKNILEVESWIEPALIGLKPVIWRQTFNEYTWSNGYIWRVAETKEQMFEILMEAAGYIQVQEFTYHEFPGYEDPSDAYYEKYAALNEFLLTHLITPKIYVFDFDFIFHFYTVGQITNGDWLGIFTSGVISP